MKRLVSVFLAVICCSVLFAKEPKEPDTYNYQRGLEELRNYNLDKGIEYLNREITNNPRNGYAHLWLGIAYIVLEDWGNALAGSDKAMQLIPKKNKNKYAYAYIVRGNAYLGLKDTVTAIADFTTAIRINPCIQTYDYRADVYFDQRKYDLAETDYKQMIRLAPDDVEGYMGYGRCLKEKNRMDEAIEMFSRVIELNGELATAYTLRGECKLTREKYAEAVNDLLEAINLDPSDDTVLPVQQIDDKAMPEVMTQLHAKMAEEQDNGGWYVVAALTCREHRQYRDAIALFKKGNTLLPDSWFDERIAECYSCLGDYERAIKYAKTAFYSDTTDASIAAWISATYALSDSVPQAVTWINRAISLQPDKDFFYYCRGKIEDEIGMVDEALEDYNTSIAINPGSARAHAKRGILLFKQGRIDQADAEFRRVLKEEPEPVDDACAMYAYFYLGDTAKAVAFMDGVMAEYPRNEFDAARLYSLLGDTAQALDYLRKALEGDFRVFSCMMKTDDLNNIRQTQEFRDLYDEFERKHQQELEAGEVEIFTLEESSDS